MSARADLCGGRSAMVVPTATLSLFPEGDLSEMAFHEKAGPGQVDFDLPFLKFPFPSWREGVQSGPERSRARSLRRSEPLTARTDLSPFRQEGKGAVARYF